MDLIWLAELDSLFDPLNQSSVLRPLAQTGDHEVISDLLRFVNLSRYSRALPVPKQTARSGLEATITGKPVSLINALSIPLINAPPPAKTIPRSTRSAASSGGHFSRMSF